MSENVFNMFVFTSGPDREITGLGAVVHTMSGRDDLMLAHLQNQVRSDLKAAVRYPLPQQFDGMTWDGFDAISDFGHRMAPFEAIFTEWGAGMSPLVCITPVVDGKVTIDGTDRFDDRPPDNVR